MSLPRFCVVVVSIVSLACGGGTPPPRALSSSWQAPALPPHVPADSPYVFATLASLNDDVRRRWLRGVQQQVTDGIRKLEAARTGSNGPPPPWMRAALSI